MYRLINDLLHPYTLLFVTMATSLPFIVTKRGRQKAWCIFTLAFVALLAMSVPVVSHFAFLSLESHTQPLNRLPEGVDTIVVLAGGLIPRNANQLREQLTDDSLYRCLKAVELSRDQRHVEVIVSGGVVHADDEGPPVAQLMREFMIQLGIDPTRLTTEDRSRTTYENAQMCKALLQERGRRHIMLVTDASHMPRAAACFRKAGLQVTEAPCHFITGDFEWRLATFLPSAGAAQGNERVVHEWLGLLWYWLRGRI